MTKTTQTFAGKVVLVTGATSGIGETSAAAFAAAGATVFGLGRRQEAVDAARSRHPAVRWLLADVTDSTALAGAIAALVREAGRLDVLVNNAAIFQFAPLEGTTDAHVRSQLEVNVLGAITAARLALPALKESRGSIVNIGSAAGHKPAPGGSVYAATKAAIESLTRSWALELAPAGVRVNAIAPGPTETPGFDKLDLPAEMIPQVKAQFVAQVPLGRIATTDEMSRWILAISDPSASFVTGQIWSIDGGMSLR